MKLVAKFVALLLLGVLILIGVDGYFAMRREIEIFDTDMQRDAEQLGGGLNALMADVWQSKGEQRVMKIIDEANKAQRLMRLRLVWLDAPRDDPSCPLAAAEQLASVTKGQIVSIRQTDKAGNQRMLTYAQVAVGSPRPAALEVAEAMTHSRDMARSFVVRMITLTSVTLLVGVALIVLLGAEMVAKPLRMLIEKTRRIGQGDLSGPIQIRRRDEFGELAAAINSMCDQLVDSQHQVNEQTAARISTLEQLRHADRLRTVGRLASGIAHELGTPLNVVGGRAGLIASGNLSEDETRRSAQIIKSETDRITTIIRQLLDFARRSSPKRATVDLRPLVEQTTDLLAPLAEKRHVTIRNLAPLSSYPAQVDAGQIQQVLTNLIVNAVQAMPDGGEIQIDMRRAHVCPPEGEEASEGPYLLISVRDEGLGIPEEDRHQLFEPFFTTKDVGDGTGLGLSIAYGIVQEHGGWIDVQSEPGKGSCFTVYLPAQVK